MSETRPISSIAKIRRGASPRPIGDPKYFSGTVGWVRIVDVTRSKRFLQATEQYLSPLGESLSIRVGPGDLIMSICGTIGRPIIVDMDACIHDGFVQFYDFKDIDRDYFFYVLQFSEAAFLGMGQPGTQTNLNTSIAGRHYIYCPPIAKQRRIASILTCIDTAIEKTEALIDKYQQIKAGLMHDLFTRGVLPNGQLRPPREQAPELYQETAIGWIPKEWEVMRIGAAFDIQLGKMLNQDAKTGKSSFPYVGNRSVQWNKVDVSALEEMDFSPSDREKFSLITGDLLVCEGGEVGRTAIWESPIENCYYQKAIHRLRPKGNHVKTRFMLRFMWYAKTTGHFDNYTSQTSIAHLTQEKLAAVPMAVPKNDEQTVLIERFDGIDSILEREQALRENLCQQKLGLMQDLLTGKVPVKVDDPATEPAHA